MFEVSGLQEEKILSCLLTSQQHQEHAARVPRGCPLCFGMSESQNPTPPHEIHPEVVPCTLTLTWMKYEKRLKLFLVYRAPYVDS